MPITLEGADEQDWAAYRALGSPKAVKDKIDDLVKDNGRYRDRHREDQEKIEAAAPKAGSVVLTKEQAAELAEYQKLGKPAEITSQVSDGAQAKARLQAIEKQKTVHEAAKLLGWQPSLAERIRGIDAAVVELREVDIRDGDKTTKGKVPYVTPAGENQKAVPLAEYVETNDPDLLPLLPSEDRPDDRKGTRAGEQTWVPQSDRGRAPRDAVKRGEKDYREATERTAAYDIV